MDAQDGRRKELLFLPWHKTAKIYALCTYQKNILNRSFTVLTALKCTRCDKDADVTGAIPWGYLSAHNTVRQEQCVWDTAPA